MSYDPGNRVRTRLVWGFPLSRGFSPAAGQLIAACCADSTLFGAAVDAARDGLPKGRRLTRPSESASPTSTIIGGTEGRRLAAGGRWIRTFGTAAQRPAISDAFRASG